MHLKIAVTSRSLFNLEEAAQIYQNQGSKAFSDYMHSIENTILEPGPAFPLIRALSNIISPISGTPLGKAVLVSQLPAECSLAVLNSIQAHKLNVEQVALTGGRDQIPYLIGFSPDLFLSLNKSDVQECLKRGDLPAVLLLSQSKLPESQSYSNPQQLRLAFDGDAVLFNKESEELYREKGLSYFINSEQENSSIPLGGGPLSKFLQKIHEIQKLFPENCPIVTALITARGSSVLERPIKTLRSWGINVNVAVGLDGNSKANALKAFNPHLFFDDRMKNCIDAAAICPSANLPVWNDQEEDFIGNSTDSH